MRRRIDATQWLVLLFAILCSTSISYATITVQSITGVSNVTGLNPVPGASPVPGTRALTIYGGLAGPEAACTSEDNVSTCNNCHVANSGRLFSCNNSRVYPNLQIKITMVSDSVDAGFPGAVSGTTTQLLTASTGSSTKETKGQPFTIIVPWSAYCTANGSATCLTNTSSTVLQVGAFKTALSSAFASGDDSVSITVFVVPDIGTGQSAISLSPNATCATSTAGICHFEMKDGDTKGVLDKITASPNFPNPASPDTVPFKFVRAYFTSDSGQYASITQESQFLDLNIVTDGAGAFHTDPKRIDGLTNDRYYYFKMALVDEAGNVGYFTSDADDHQCTNGTDCHRVLPGEVLGVLANKTNCFIATAAYGSKMAPEVQTFRNFRDTFLVPYKWGRKFVLFYYKHSPYYADIIAQNETLRAISRTLLWPLWLYAQISLKFGALLANGLTLLFLLSLAQLLRLKRRSAK